MKVKHSLAMVVLFACLGAQAQVNSGSNGADGALSPSDTGGACCSDFVINMADHPDGIYHYTSVNIPPNRRIRFIANRNNTPVVWLVQSNCVIEGNIYLSGESAIQGTGGAGGPGGWRGGNGGSAATAGSGPGGGAIGGYAVCASFGSPATNCTPIAPTYGNQFLLPFLGGSGGGGAAIDSAGGGGGGGALLIVASGQIQLSGGISADGGSGTYIYSGGIAGGAGSGGAVRLVGSKIVGSGSVSVRGATAGNGYPRSGDGRVRFDTLDNAFGGKVYGVFTWGYQPIINQANGQGAQLTITSVGGIPISGSPNGQLATPDAVLSAQQKNPTPIVVHCSNIPLNTQITVSVKPANGTPLSATGLNSSGTLLSSTATVLLNMPRGGGIIYATAAN